MKEGKGAVPSPRPVVCLECYTSAELERANCIADARRHKEVSRPAIAAIAREAGRVQQVQHVAVELKIPAAADIEFPAEPRVDVERTGRACPAEAALVVHCNDMLAAGHA